MDMQIFFGYESGVKNSIFAHLGTEVRTVSNVG